MPIRVSCPSCGRAGRVPDNAVGRNVTCPACQHRYVLQAENAAPEGLELLDDDETIPLAPVATPTPAPPPRPFSAAAPRLSGPGRERPLPNEPEDEDDGEPNSKVPLYAAIAGGAVALLGVAAAVGVFLFGGRTPDPAPTQLAAAPVVAPATPVRPAVETNPIPAADPGRESNPIPAVKGTRGTNPIGAANPVRGTNPIADTDAAVETNPIADTEPAGGTKPISTAVAGAGNETKPISAPEPAAVAAATSAKSDSPGRVMTTAEIVDESEPSIALVKGKASSGTGFLVRPGIVATNAHVIDDEFVSSLEVRFPSADEAHEGPVSAELLFEDAKRDLAFLAVKTDLPPLRVATSYKFRKGEDITVIGNPGLGGDLVLENAINKGVMSTKATLDGQNYYQLGVSINPGNSGGPVFDSTGRVIGVATLKTTKQEALAFSIPAEELQAALVRLDGQSDADLDKLRSRHRVVNAVKGMMTGGAVYCIGVDLRRAATLGAVAIAPEIGDALKKIEAAIPEMEKDLFSAISAELPGIKADPSVDKVMKGRVDEMSANFGRIKSAYGKAKSKGGVDDDALRRMKSTHKRLITDLTRTLKLELPAEMLTVFDDRPTPGPSQTVILRAVPPSAGSLRERIQGRRPTAPPSAGSRLRSRSRIPGG